MKTETKVQHTPTPWKVRQADAVSPDVIAITSNGITVALVPIEDIHDEKANAAFIVRAVNCHEELKAQLKAAVDLLKTMIVDETEASLVIHHVRQYEACIAKAESL